MLSSAAINRLYFRMSVHDDDKILLRKGLVIIEEGLNGLNLLDNINFSGNSRLYRSFHRQPPSNKPEGTTTPLSSSVAPFFPLIRQRPSPHAGALNFQETRSMCERFAAVHDLFMSRKLEILETFNNRNYLLSYVSDLLYLLSSSTVPSYALFSRNSPLNIFNDLVVIIMGGISGVEQSFTPRGESLLILINTSFLQIINHFTSVYNREHVTNGH